MATGCGCGCGGSSGSTPAFVRPRFFAGQLLTEDDLGLLVDYMTAKHRLHNRSLSGPGVVCGLDVACDPCGGGGVLVRPGHALDCAGHDIVVPCAERVDVRALVRQQRVDALGADCGDPCEDDGARRYGLFVRYEETPVEPVAPYATEEPCPSPGCVPSRLQEGYRFLVRRDEVADHRHNPETRLRAFLGDLTAAGRARDRDQRLGFYLDALYAASLAPGRAFRFDAADAKRYADSLAWLRTGLPGDGELPAATARTATEHVRALASALARFDTHDRAGRDQLVRDYPDLATAGDARGVLATACDRLTGTATEAVWPDPLHRTIARAVVTETRARVVPGAEDSDAPLELRLVAQGAPLSHALQAEFRTDLAVVRDWLLGRLDLADGLADCSLRADTARIELPRQLPTPPPDSVEKITSVDLRQLAEATAALTTALRRFLTDAACATLSPPCPDCSDTDVLLARVELDGCDVVRVCFATREQVVPGGSAYGEWLTKLPALRALAERLCCRPTADYRPPDIPGEGSVPRPYAEGLLGEWRRTGDLEEMLTLLLTDAPGETVPDSQDTGFAVESPPEEAAAGRRELALLQERVTELTTALEGLRRRVEGASRQTGGESPAPRPDGAQETPDGQDSGPARPPSRTPSRKPRAPRTPKTGETT